MRALARTLGDYLFPRDDEPPFGPSDAIALGLLLLEARARQSGLVDFYGAAFGATCAALGLNGAALLDAAGFDGPRDPHRMPIAHLGRLRSAMARFCDEWGPVMEGDIWGEKVPAPRAREAIAAARAWYEQQRATSMQHGVRALDDALLLLLGWSTERTVSRADLLRVHGFPSDDAFEW